MNPNAIESKNNLALKPLAAAIGLLLSASTHAASLHITPGDTRTLNDAYSFADFYQSGGTLTGGGAVSIGGSSIW
ncbi:MAG: hypothetical protein PHH11_13775, partial [Methylomonas sp.]|nr:hypothetical protein [Methylomonas sp.]